MNDLCWSYGKFQLYVTYSYDNTWTARAYHPASRSTITRRGFKLREEAKQFLQGAFYPPLNAESPPERWEIEAGILGITVSDLKDQINIIDSIITELFAEEKG